MTALTVLYIIGLFIYPLVVFVWARWDEYDFFSLDKRKRTRAARMWLLTPVWFVTAFWLVGRGVWWLVKVAFPKKVKDVK